MFPNITYELLQRGYSEKDIRKILGENLLRVFADAERIARGMSKNISGDGSLKRIPGERAASGASVQLTLAADYRIKPKDLVEIHLAGVFDSCCLEVDGRGVLQVPYVMGDVYANGKTAIELSAELVTYFKRHQKKPEILVRVYRGDLGPQ